MRDPWECRTADGMIMTGASPGRIEPAFRDILTGAISAVSAPGASLYVYGSVATGQAEVGRSDVDLLGIGFEAERARIVSAELSDRFADRCRGVAIGAAAAGDFEGDHDEAYGNRVFLRHYCVLLSGSDRYRPGHDFPADARAARGFNGDIARHCDRWRGELPDSPDPSALATRIARKTLLAVAGLVSVHDDTWTTDRAVAVTRWSEVEAEFSAGLTTLFEWTGGAVHVERDEITRVLEETVDPLVGRFAGEVGLWPEP